MLSTRAFALSRVLPNVRPLGVAASRRQHTLPELRYDYNALEPVISGEIMQIHHQKHHQTYVNNLNAAEAKLKEAVEKNDIGAMISLQPALKFNGGGHLNHTIFWEVLSPTGGGMPSGHLLEMIVNNFGSFDTMRDELTAATIAIQGSGWGWLGWSPSTDRLKIATCANQDPLLPTAGSSSGLVPLFGIDVWEHAYYLQYKNVRPDYVKAIFDIANWEEAGNRLAKAKVPINI